MLRSLTSTSILDLLLEHEQRSVDVVVSKGSERGVLALRSGRVVHAELAGVRGKPALERILGMTEGTCEISETSAPTNTSLDIPVAEAVRDARARTLEAARGPVAFSGSRTRLGFPTAAELGTVKGSPALQDPATPQGRHAPQDQVPPKRTAPAWATRTLLGSGPAAPAPVAAGKTVSIGEPARSPSTPPAPASGTGPLRGLGLGGKTLMGTGYSSAPPAALAEDRVPGGLRQPAIPKLSPLSSTLLGPAAAAPQTPQNGAAQAATLVLETQHPDVDTGPVPSSQLDPSALRQLAELHEAISSTLHPIPQRPIEDQEEWPPPPPAEETAPVAEPSVHPRVGRYEVLVRLKSGGMGSIYLCRLSGSAGFQRLFAMKVLHTELVEQPEALDLFFSEARLLAQLHHPHIVGIVDVGTVHQPYLVLDYVEGGSLHELLRATGYALEPGVVLSILLDALRGLSAAHQLVGEHGEELGIVHNDISPHNLLVGVDGTCRVADFGVAKARGFSPGSLSTRGKPSYVAPERLLNQPFDHRADIFSCGVVLYQALTGVDPFRGATVEETLRNVLERPILPPSEVGLRPPPALDWVCMKALARNPVERFQSAEEMANQLRRVAAREDLLVPPSRVAQVVRASLGSNLEAARAAAQGAAVGTSAARSETGRPSTIPPGALSSGASAAAEAPDTELASPPFTEPPPSSGDFRERTEVLTLPPTDNERRFRNVTLYVVLVLTAAALVLVLFFPERIQSVLRKQPPRPLSSEEVLLKERAAAERAASPREGGKRPDPERKETPREVQLPPIELHRDSPP
jgi:serine/threonine-protein kinase